MDFSCAIDPVCFFDSGTGGLNLMYECRRRLPSADFIYFADNYNVPYGVMTDSKIKNAVEVIFDKIEKYNPSAAVIACNTVTAKCAAYLREKYAFPIIGIQPAVKPAVRNGEKCVVLATPVTAASASVKDLVSHFGNDKTEVVACPDLASYVERNIFNLDADEVLKLLPETKADSIVLGCTHYVFIENIVKTYYKCPVYDGLSGTAAHLCKILGKPDHRTDNISEISGNTAFIGGDEVKNRRVFEELLSHNGVLLGK